MDGDDPVRQEAQRREEDDMKLNKSRPPAAYLNKSIIFFLHQYNHSLIFIELYITG